MVGCGHLQEVTEEEFLEKNWPEQMFHNQNDRNRTMISFLCEHIKTSHIAPALNERQSVFKKLVEDYHGTTWCTCSSKTMKWEFWAKYRNQVHDDTKVAYIATLGVNYWFFLWRKAWVHIDNIDCKTGLKRRLWFCI